MGDSDRFQSPVKQRRYTERSLFPVPGDVRSSVLDNLSAADSVPVAYTVNTIF